MTKKSRLTKEQVQELKNVIRTGEPICSIAERLAPVYKKPETSFRVTLYNLAKRTYKIAEWKGPKRRSRKAASVELEISKVITRVEKHKDHIRIYL